MPLTPYLRRKPTNSARLRLFCLAHAGGGSSLFARWVKLVPDWVEICPVLLPAREGRFRDPAFTDLLRLSETLARELSPHLDQPFALFGHSLGALVQFELARRLRELQLPAPQKLLVSAARAPHRPRPFPPLVHLGDEAFLAELRRRYGGIGPEVMEHPELLAICLPSLRGDFTMLETYRHQASPPLSIPIAAFAGMEDEATTPADIEPWREWTTAQFQLHLLPGGHFFINSHREQFLEVLVRELAQVVPG